MFRVKICGVTNSSDAELAARCGADAIGLNFYPSSPRAVTVSAAGRIVDALPPGVARVGVFVNHEATEVLATADALNLDYLQLHGDETAEYVGSLGAGNVVKAFRCRDDDFAAIGQFVDRCARLGRPLAAVLVDAFSTDRFGGTGRQANWDLVRNLRDACQATPIILAGGLRPENVAQAIRTARPDAVDTASGVEARPGCKDRELVTAFVRAAADALAAGT